MGWLNKKTGKQVDVKEESEEVQPQIKTQVKQRVDEREMVVNELPNLPQRKIRGDDGNIYHLSTLAEAVQEILENTREILKIAKEE